MAYSGPAAGDVHVNRPLTNISLAYIQDEGKFVADRMFPNIPVESQSDVYYTHDRGSYNRDQMKERAPGTESALMTLKLSDDTYHARAFSLGHNLADQIMANMDDVLAYDTMVTLALTSQAMIKRERNWVSKYLKTAVWTFEVDGAGTATTRSDLDPSHATNNDILYWNNESATPIEDVRFIMDSMEESTGYRPNKLAISRKAWSRLLDHPDIVARLDRGQTPGGPAMSNMDAIAALFELDEILVMAGIYNSAGEGVTNDHSFIAGKHALLAYVPPAPGVMIAAAGYTFSWTGYTGATSMGHRMKRFRDELTESDRIEIAMAFDHKRVAADLGCFLNGIVQ